MQHPLSTYASDGEGVVEMPSKRVRTNVNSIFVRT